MRWMCCRAGVWGCGFPLWGCVWAGSGWGPWVGLEPGLRSPLAWICSIDSEPSSASVLPDPIFPGKPDTAHSLWLSSRESPGPTAPWQRSRRSRRQPELCNYWGRTRPGVLVHCDVWKMMINTHHMLQATFQAETSNPSSNNRAPMCDCLLFMWWDPDVHHILPRLKAN